jgi:Domain of unknown function (DUF3883)
MITLRQPEGVQRRKLNDDQPCSAYEIYRAVSGQVLGESHRTDHGWQFRRDGSDEWVLVTGDAPHTRAMYWLSGDRRFTVDHGTLAGPSVMDLLNDPRPGGGTSQEPDATEDRSARLAQTPTAPVVQGSQKGSGYWWEQEPAENVWMEITRREDIGTDLKAPTSARGGVTTASYVLVPLVQPGDIVIHYDSRQEAITGVSVAASTAEAAPIYWVARGGYARRAGEQARWLPGLRVALQHYRPLQPPVTLTEIRQDKDLLLGMRDRIQQAARGKPIYFPWIPYQDTLRTFQSYLVKMPQDAISLFPQLRDAVDQASALASELTLPSPAQQAADAVKDAAGKVGRPGRGQGFQVDQEAKAAIEALAMNMATKFYSSEWKVKDVHGAHSYDLVCRRGSEVKHVEVKGTTTDGAEVILTPNEVKHAKEHPHTALYVLSNITVERGENGTITASGGKEHCYDPWRLDDGTLIPVGFRYQLPTERAK